MAEWLKQHLIATIAGIIAVGAALFGHWNETKLLKKDIAALKLAQGAIEIRLAIAESTGIKVARIEGTLAVLQARQSPPLQLRGLPKELPVSGPGPR